MNIFSSKNIESFLNHYGIFIIIGLTIFLSLWKLGQHPVEDWDEARRGINAISMIEKKDRINYYYGNERDNINAKPPLAIWFIAVNYHIFGYNAFALRLHSALAIMLAFFFIYKICRLYYNSTFSSLVCLLLLGCKGLIGYHVGRTGDTDALLTMFILGGTYFFLKYYDREYKNSLLLSAIFFGLAFYSKGFAVFLIFPALMIYMLLTKSLRHVVKDPKLWISLFVFTLIVSNWFILQKTLGNPYKEVSVTGANNLQTLFIYDVLKRFFSTDFGMEYDPWYFFDVIDAGFNLWNYSFYFILIITVYLILIKRIKISEYFKKPANHLLLLSILISLTITLILTISKNKCRWYLAPIYPFVAILTVKGMFYLVKKQLLFQYLWIGLLLFTLTRHYLYLNTIKPSIQLLFDRHKYEIESHTNINVFGDLTQTVFLYLKWTNKPINYIENPTLLKQYIQNRELVFIPEQSLSEHGLHNDSITMVCDFGYCFFNL